MIKKLLTSIDQMASPPDSSEIHELDYMRIKAANKFIIMGLFLCTALIIFNTLMGLYQAIIIDLSITIILSISFYLNKKKKSNLGIPLFIISCTILAFLPFLFMPYLQGSSLVFFAFVGAPFIFINPKQKFYRYLSVFLCISFFISAKYFVIRTPFLNPTDEIIAGVFMSLVTFTLVIFQYHYWEVANHNTWKKLLEKQSLLMESNQLSSIGIMSAGIAHEINNPLTIILGINHKLSREIKKYKLNGDTITISLTKQIIAIERIGKIINGMKVLSRDTRDDQMASEDIHNIIKESVDFCIENANAKGIEVILENLIGHEFINCKRVQIGQVIINLIGNAIDAVCEHKIPWIKVQLSKGEENIIIKIIDSGGGIPQDIQKKILTPFFTTKPIGKGTGLGLSLSSNIIDGHHGKMSIDQDNPNTCFVLTLPCAPIKDNLKNSA